jgi:membrane-associated protease RseP (regulator of RpoE activity)
MMSRLPASALLLLAALLALGGIPGDAAAQVVAVQPAPRGWVGISYDIRADADGLIRVVIIDVSEGSPAQLAGVEVGDHLVSLNGQDAENNFANLPLHIRPGDPVDLMLARNGRPHRVRLTAAQRPRRVADEVAVTLTVTGDSVVESMFRAMDSLRLTLVTSVEGRTVSVRRQPIAIDSEAPVAEVVGTPAPRLLLERTPGGDMGRGSAPGPDLHGAEQSWMLEEVRAPFGFWVFTDRQTDSLSRAMNRLNTEIRALRVQEADRRRRMVDASGESRADPRDEQFVELSEVIKSYADRSAALRQAMDRAVRDAAEPRTGFIIRRQESGEPDEEGGSVRRLFGPLTPYALGQNRAAGAEVTDLQPELAAYFEVRGGVLVVDVFRGTPAAIAGILPGDVITHLDQVTIRSVEELRVGLARAGESLPVTVVRRGNALQLLLRR